uniref:Uncharacterized protein n=1 Tax=Chromera velia CCMP2878 TaxID=1169474 RepID=A0A0G4G2F3_9ALVE|eukprot:Cvel_4084.t1-p1 / transcript=Cvel_4084.t1 / gene=Cvel_4084 / organism=Chromera_velia_CCMP2878 / gene_product=hypothetical protein / transcript_product=hypothetical protein / location=Cvel_scaffold174:16107-20719(-) / protein_length=971 / sequence_SO=supercontig / SO=protein_coding / is_pseudo=false
MRRGSQAGVNSRDDPETPAAAHGGMSAAAEAQQTNGHHPEAAVSTVPLQLYQAHPSIQQQAAAAVATGAYWQQQQQQQLQSHQFDLAGAYRPVHPAAGLVAAVPAESLVAHAGDGTATAFYSLSGADLAAQYPYGYAAHLHQLHQHAALANGAAAASSAGTLVQPQQQVQPVAVAVPYGAVYADPLANAAAAAFQQGGVAAGAGGELGHVATTYRGESSGTLSTGDATKKPPKCGIANSLKRSKQFFTRSCGTLTGPDTDLVPAGEVFRLKPSRWEEGSVPHEELVAAASTPPAASAGISSSFLHSPSSSSSSSRSALSGGHPASSSAGAPRFWRAPGNGEFRRLPIELIKWESLPEALQRVAICLPKKGNYQGPDRPVEVALAKAQDPSWSPWVVVDNQFSRAWGVNTQFAFVRRIEKSTQSKFYHDVRLFLLMTEDMAEEGLADHNVRTLCRACGDHEVPGVFAKHYTKHTDRGCWRLVSRTLCIHEDIEGKTLPGPVQHLQQSQQQQRESPREAGGAPLIPLHLRGGRGGITNAPPAAAAAAAATAAVHSLVGQFGGHVLLPMKREGPRVKTERPQSSPPHGHEQSQPARLVEGGAHGSSDETGKGRGGVSVVSGSGSQERPADLGAGGRSGDGGEGIDSRDGKRQRLEEQEGDEHGNGAPYRLVRRDGAHAMHSHYHSHSANAAGRADSSQHSEASISRGDHGVAGVLGRSLSRASQRTTGEEEHLGFGMHGERHEHELGGEGPEFRRVHSGSFLHCEHEPSSGSGDVHHCDSTSFFHGTGLGSPSDFNNIGVSASSSSSSSEHLIGHRLSLHGHGGGTHEEGHTAGGGGGLSFLEFEPDAAACTGDPHDHESGDAGGGAASFFAHVPSLQPPSHTHSGAEARGHAEGGVDGGGRGELGQETETGGHERAPGTLNDELNHPPSSLGAGGHYMPQQQEEEEEEGDETFGHSSPHEAGPAEHGGGHRWY